MQACRWPREVGRSIPINRAPRALGWLDLAEGRLTPRSPLPRHGRYRGARHRCCRHDLPLQRFGPSPVLSPNATCCVHYRICGHFPSTPLPEGRHSPSNQLNTGGGLHRRDTQIAHPAPVLPPAHLARVEIEPCAGQAVVDADFRASGKGERALGLVRVKALPTYSSLWFSHSWSAKADRSR